MFFLGISANFLFYGLIWAMVMICCHLGNQTSKEYDITIDSFVTVADHTEIISSPFSIDLSQQDFGSEYQDQQIIHLASDENLIIFNTELDGYFDMAYNHAYLKILQSNLTLRAPPYCV